ncbi:hypothetical protein [Phaeacidiphilus oryzae]|uniref:hypothetical protein n=1 Tax=Phaeacidiphilus oryzae TaxID=348818 RepID=UPI000567222F|nr:hypothetical protein [Phaeacidiphilus oryzae]
MKNTGKIAVAVAGGYLLGRGHNAKLAIGLGLWLTGKKISIDPARLPELVQRLPILGELNEQVRGDLTRIGKEVGSKALTAQGDRLADALNRRTESLRGAASAAADGGADAEEDAEEPEDENESADREEESGTARASKSSRDGSDDGSDENSGKGSENGGERGSAQSRTRPSRPAKTADAASRPARGAARKPASGAKRAASSAAHTPARKRATAKRTDGGGRNG